MIVYTWISSPNGRMITAICRVAIITIQKKIKLYLCWMWVFCPANHETLKQVQWKMRGKQFLQSALIFPKSFPAVSFWFDTAAPQAEFSDIYHYVSFCSHILILFMILSAFPDLQPLPPLWLPMFFPQVGRGSDQQSGLRWPGGSLEPTAEGRRRRGKQSHQSRRPHHCAEWRWAERRWSPGKVEDLWPARAKGFSWAGDVEIGRVYICAYRITIYIFFCQFNIGPFNDTK